MFPEKWQRTTRCERILLIWLYQSPSLIFDIWGCNSFVLWAKNDDFYQPQEAGVWQRCLQLQDTDNTDYRLTQYKIQIVYAGSKIFLLLCLNNGIRT